MSHMPKSCKYGYVLQIILLFQLHSIAASNIKFTPSDSIIEFPASDMALYDVLVATMLVQLYFFLAL